MIDTVQAVLLFVIVLLTILFIVLGVQVFYLLKDFRETVKRTNRILDDVEIISDGVKTTVVSVSDAVSGVTSMTTVAKILQIFKK